MAMNDGRHKMGDSEWDAEAMAEWRKWHQQCEDRIASIRIGLNDNTLATSELEAIDEALTVAEELAYPKANG